MSQHFPQRLPRKMRFHGKCLGNHIFVPVLAGGHFNLFFGPPGPLVHMIFLEKQAKSLVIFRNFLVTPTPSTFSKVLLYKWEAYCSPNGRCTVGFLSMGLSLCKPLGDRAICRACCHVRGQERFCSWHESICMRNRHPVKPFRLRLPSRKCRSVTPDH